MPREMRTEEFRELMGRYGLTKDGAAKLWGVDRRTVQRWFKGEMPVNPLVFFIFKVVGKLKKEESDKILNEGRMKR